VLPLNKDDHIYIQIENVIYNNELNLEFIHRTVSKYFVFYDSQINSTNFIYFQ